MFKNPEERHKKNKSDSNHSFKKGSKMRLKSLFSFLLIALSVLVMAGCSPSGNSPDPQPQDDKRGFVPSESGNDGTKTIMVSKNGKFVPVTVAIKDGLVVYQGDVVLGKAKDLEGSSISSQSFSALKSGLGKAWTNHVLPYVIDSGFSSSERARILAAIKEVDQKTNVVITERESQEDYVYFKPVSAKEHCWSYIGMLGGKQEIGISTACTKANIIHEIGHALGLAHEHNRADRDKYVEINWSNINPDYRYNFDLDAVGSQYGAYDYASIMHYNYKAFAIDKSKATITPKASNYAAYKLGNNTLSNGDIAGINHLYPVEASSQGSLLVTPPNDYYVAGLKGQKLFEPEKMCYSLTNVGGAKIDYEVKEDIKWLELSKENGALRAGESDVVCLDIVQAEAAKLDSGSYSETVSFVNVTNQKGNSNRKVNLHVSPSQADVDWRVNQDKLDFSAKLGAMAPLQTIRLYNDGESEGHYNISYSNSWFSFSNKSGTVASHGAKDIKVAVKPCTAIGSQSDEFTISGDGDDVKVKVNYECKAVAQTPNVEWRVDHDQLDFAAKVGAMAPLKKLRLYNDGNAVGHYSVSAASAWLNLGSTSGTVEAGSSKDINVLVTPCTSVGTRSDKIKIVGDDDSLTVDVNYECKAIGTTPNVDWRVNKDELDFSANVGAMAPFQKFRLYNDGDTAGHYSITGPSSWMSFGATSGTVAANSSKEITVTVIPCTSVGSRSGELKVEGDGDSVSVNVNYECKAIGATPQVEWRVNHDHLDFVSKIGSMAPFKKIRLYNDGDKDGNYSITGPLSWISFGASSGTVAANSSKEITVTVVPCTSVGTQNGTITIEGSGDTVSVDVSYQCKAF